MNLKNMLYRTFSKDARGGLSIKPQEAFNAVQKGQAILLDVREQDEVKNGMAAQAKWLPTSEIEAQTTKAREFIINLPKDKKIIVYCAAGVRAGRFATMLENQGYQAFNLGGFDDWVGAGLPVTTHPTSQ